MKPLGLLALATALAACLAVPAAASPPQALQHTTMTVRGTGADATWHTEPVVGRPHVFSLSGFRASGLLQRYHEAGSRPDQFRLPALLAMGMLVPGDDGPQPAEVWCLPSAKATTFTIDARLTSAKLAMSCDAEVYLGEGDEPSGQTMPLRVSASWTGAGALVSQKGVTQTRGDGWRTLERTNSKQRPATAMVRIVGPDGVLFEGPVSNDDMGSRASLFNAAESMMMFGPVPEQ